MFVGERERSEDEDRTFEAEKRSKTVAEPKRTRENCVCGQRQLMKPQGTGTHWAQSEKLLVLAFHIITVALSERSTPSGGMWGSSSQGDVCVWGWILFKKCMVPELHTCPA